MYRILRSALPLFLFSTQALSFEHTKVLPRGVRNFSLRAIGTDICEKTDRYGHAQPLAEPLAKELTFAKILNGESGLKRQQLEAFLNLNGYSQDESVGRFSADLKGRVDVTAPVFSYGLTDTWTIALAVPYYRAKTAVAVGFKPNGMANNFLAKLQEPLNNQTVSAREAAEKYNNAVGELNNKLSDNAYSELGSWSGQGLGDTIVAAKNRSYQSEHLAVAVTAGFVAPTGRGDNPDILTDLGFGDQQWDIFSQLTLDQPLVGGLVVSEYAKFTHQAAGTKNVRAKTEDEAIEVETRQVAFKLGDKVDAGASLVYEHSTGLSAGVGYAYFRKDGDRYRGIGTDSAREWEKDTNQSANYAEYKLGYSTLPAFQSGTFKVPLAVGVEYKRQLSSRNMPISNLAQAEFSLFF